MDKLSLILQQFSMMLDLAHIYVFVKVAELKSITAAARSLRVSKSSVSRDLVKLETAVGAGLLHRTTRRITLTDAGLSFQQHCLRILKDVQEAEAAVSLLQSAPRGHLRVKAPITFGQSFLGPFLADFIARYPNMTIELQLEGGPENDGREADVVIRVGRLDDTSLVARRLANVPLHLCASPRYLNDRRPPRSPSDLSDHALIAATTEERVWVLEKESGKKLKVPISPRIIVDGPVTVREAVLAGAGLGWIPDPLCAKDVAEQRLVRVDLAGWSFPPAEVHALFPGNGIVTPKVRAFIDFLVEKFGLRPGRG